MKNDRSMDSGNNIRLHHNHYLHSEKEKTKRQKMKIEATLRSEEMARGYRPGTYSSMEDMEENEGSNLEDGKRKMTREELEKGIADLDERLKNLDSIMKNKKN